MKRFLPLLLGLPLLGGCIEAFDGIWFSPERIDEYVLPLNEVPLEYLEIVSIPGTQVEGESEAPVLAGIWAHQCLDDQGGCVVPDAEEFDPANQDKTILYFHGNSRSIDHYWGRVQMLWKLGYRVFAIDYRGYGVSTGEPSEAGVYADARSALDHVLERFVEDNPNLAGADGDLPNPLFLPLGYYGWSLGSTAAIDLSVDYPSKVLVTEAALASAQAFLDDGAGLGLSSSVLMDASFDNLAKIPLVISPKLLTHGTEDDYVRFEFSQLLYDVAEEPKELYPVLGASHGNVPCPTRPPDADNTEVPCIADDPWLENVGGFLSEHLQ